MEWVRFPGSITSRAPIPVERWDEVHIDWIVALPMPEEGYDNILVCVERITKFAYFIPAKSTDTAQDTAMKEIICSNILCTWTAKSNNIRQR